MKKMIQMFLVALCAVVMFTACSDSNSPKNSQLKVFEAACVEDISSLNALRPNQEIANAQVIAVVKAQKLLMGDKFETYKNKFITALKNAKEDFNGDDYCTLVFTDPDSGEKVEINLKKVNGFWVDSQ